MAARKGTAIVTPEVGTVFGGWTYLGQVTGNRRWLCLCACGRQVAINSINVRQGISKTCGCVKPGPVTHGQSYSATYSNWRSMIARCHNHNAPAFAAYGGKGIAVAPAWHTFANFLADMGHRPTEKLSLERLDNSKGYAPGNVVWADRYTQAANRKSTRWVLANGETLPLSVWARRQGLLDGTVRSRIYQLNWPLEKALDLPGATFTMKI